MPIRRPSNSTRSQRLLQRLRSYAPLIGITLLMLLYWSWPESLTRTDWSKFAYVQYATDDHNLCNALMVFERLKHHGSKADRVLLHHPEWATTQQGALGRNAELLSLAVKKYDVKLKPVRLLDQRTYLLRATLSPI